MISPPGITRRKYKNTHTNTLIIKFCFLAALRGLDSPTLTISVMDVAHGLVTQQVLLSSRFVFVVLYSFPCLPLGERRKEKTPHIFFVVVASLFVFTHSVTSSTSRASCSLDDHQNMFGEHSHFFPSV